MRELQARLRLLRQDTGKKQSEIAEVIGVAQSTYTLYETGRREPSLDVICKLAEHYHTSIDYLMGRSDVKTPVNEAAYDKAGLSERLMASLRYLRSFELTETLSIVLRNEHFIEAIARIKNASVFISRYEQADGTMAVNAELFEGMELTASAFRNAFAMGAKQHLMNMVDEVINSNQDAI